MPKVLFVGNNCDVRLVQYENNDVLVNVSDKECDMLASFLISGSKKPIVQKSQHKSELFEIGDYIKHRVYGYGTILGNYHKRGGTWYWHVAYDNGTYGYNAENYMKLIRREGE